MQIYLMRRHGPHCPAGHPQDSATGELEERRRNAKKCSCRIYAWGTLAGVFHKLATKQRDWERAKEIIAPYVAAGRWDDVVPVPPPPSTDPAPPAGDPLCAAPEAGFRNADAVKAFLKSHQTSQSAPNTIKKYREVLGQFERFGADLGLRYVEEWTRAHVRQLVLHWGETNGPLTVQKKLGALKAFFEPFFEDRILAENPARIKTRQNRAFRLRAGTNSKQKNPFTDAELKQMLEGCRSLGRTEIREWPKKSGGRQVVAITQYRDYHRKWTGEDLADFISLSYFTGLRISDVATFEASRLTPEGEVRLRATKNGTWVSVWIPEWLRQRIRLRAARFGESIFGTHTSTDMNVITDVWRRKLNVLWESNGPWKEKPTHHRFRHTFVRILLERHVPVALVAELAGDTEQMIRRHYSAWMPERQQSASRVLAEAFRDVPRFHV
jgi:integrase